MRVPAPLLKLGRDFQAIGGRLALAVMAMVFGLICVVALSSSSTILTRDITSAYTTTNPASGILDIGFVDDELLERVRALPEVSEAEAANILHTRVRLEDGSFGRGILFVSSNPLTHEIGKLRLEEQGASNGNAQMYLERRALNVADVQIGGEVSFDLPGVGFTQFTVAGTVFDPALAPAEQEQAVYGYIDRSTWAKLTSAPLELIKIRVSGDLGDQENVDQKMAKIASTLGQEQVDVHLVQVPYAQTHPHANQMNAVLSLFMVFGATAFLLSAFLVSVTIEGLMVQQVRQIAIMKTIGARQKQIQNMYFSGVAILGLAAFLIAVPIGLVLGNGLAQSVSSLLNFDITTTTPSVGLITFWIVTSIGTPIVFAIRPLLRATGLSVISALSDQISSSVKQKQTITILLGSGTRRLATAGLLRNPWRSALAISLLTLAGAITLSARNVAAGYTLSTNIAAEERLQDIQLILTDPISAPQAAAVSAALPNMVPLDAALVLEAATIREDGLTLVRTYPDGGHGSLSLIALPSTKNIQHHKVLQGSTIGGLSNGIILNQSALAMLGNPAIGKVLNLSVDGAAIRLPLTAVIRQYMSPANAYISAAELKSLQGFSGVNSLVYKASPEFSTKMTVSTIDTLTQAWGVGVANVVSENQMVKAVSGHIRILTVTLTSLGLMMAAVGALGLMTTQGISVVERRSEFGILRAIGARRGQILTSILSEGIVLWSFALIAGVLVSIPVSQFLSSLIGEMTFGMALPFSFDFATLLIWALGSLVGVVLASSPPAFSAIRESVNSSLNRQ
ncbi:ABC transporter permease [Maritalea myrionectae]|uniref:ABC transporter permease n=1 Tax=Maritalea myrionectae TaxID=454601 RepID=UPI000422A16B|nr:ABC transporter permease [Maritalea myrionectae]